MRIYNIPMEDRTYRPTYECIVENIKDEEMDLVYERFRDTEFCLDSYGYDNEVTVSIRKENYGFTKAEFISEVRRIANGR